MSVFQHNVDLHGFMRRFPVSTLLILINTGVFIGTILSGGFTEINLVRLGGLFYYGVIIREEYYRLISAIFLHGSILHYLFNTFFGIAIISAGLEKLIGSWKFLITYLGSGIISSVIIIYLSRNSLTVGASGAIYGVLGVFLYIILYKKNLISYSDRMYIRNLFIINLVFTFLAPNISIVGHLGGVVAGFIIGFLLFLFDKRDFYYYYD